MTNSKTPESGKTFSTSHGNYQSTQSTTSSTSSTSAFFWANASVETEPHNQVFQQIQELNKDVDSTLEFMFGVNDILCSTIPVNVFLIMLGCFGITSTSLGIRYLEDCPAESKIPVFLFVLGCFGVLKVVHVVWTNFKMRRHSDYITEPEGRKSQRAVEIVDGVLNLFLIAWQVTGTFWTLHIWYPHSKPPLYEPNNWCDESLYVFTLVEIGLAFALVLGRITFQICLLICYKCTDIFEG